MTPNGEADLDGLIVTEKWNPLTFAIYQGDLRTCQYIISKSLCPLKKLMKVPGFLSTQEFNRYFPLMVAIQKDNLPMFEYFWRNLGFLWNEDTIDIVFRLMAKRYKVDWIRSFFGEN